MGESENEAVREKYVNFFKKYMVFALVTVDIFGKK